MAASLASTLVLLVAGVALEVYVRSCIRRRVNISARLQAIPIYPRLLRDAGYDGLVRVLARGDPNVFHTIWDFDAGTALSKEVYLPTPMFGTDRYRYRPGLRILNFGVWTGIRWTGYVTADIPEIERALEGCTVVGRAVVETDENGFKRTGIPVQPGAPSLVFLGDSFTEGLYTPGERTFVGLIGQSFRDSGIDANSINLGVNGYGVLEMAWTVETFCPNLQPHVVVVNLFPNDVHGDYVQVVQGRDIPEENYVEMFRYLDRIRASCARLGARLVVSAIPCKQQIVGIPGDGVFQQRVAAWCGSAGVLFLDPLPEFRRLGTEEVYLSWDPHFSESGHRHYARFLLDCLGSVLREAFRP